MRTIFFILLFICIPGIVHCSRKVPVHMEKPLLYVSIPPQKYFVEKIVGGLFRVETLIPPGASPHTFEPKPAQMTDLAKARAFFSIGVEMEKKWLPKIKELNPQLIVIATDSGINKRHGSFEHDTDHDHSMAHDEHDHRGTDPHIWLSPDLVKHQVTIVTDAVCKLDSVHCNEFRQHLSDFTGEIDTVKQRLKNRLSNCNANKHFLVFHPSWGYFAEAFSLTQIAIEVEGKEPSGRELETILTIARKNGCSAILVQPQFSQKMAHTIAHHLGGTVAVADPMAADWSANLYHVADLLCGNPDGNQSSAKVANE